MRKIILASAIVASISTVHAEGVIGNQVSISAGYPFISNLSDYSGFKSDVSVDYFFTDNLYVVGGVDVEYFSADAEDDTFNVDVSASLTTVKTGVGLGYEKSFINNDTRKVSLYGEGRLSLVTMALDTEMMGLNITATSEGAAFDAEVGARARNGSLLSEVGINFETVNVDDEQSDDLSLKAMVAYQLTDNLYAGIDTSLDFDGDYTYLGVKGGYQW